MGEGAWARGSMGEWEHMSECRGIEVSMWKDKRNNNRAVIASDPTRAGARRSQPFETAAVASLHGDCFVPFDKLRVLAMTGS